MACFGRTLLGISLLVMGFVVSTEGSWTGNKCSRVLSAWRSRRECYYRTWLGCCGYRWVRYRYYYTGYYCCPGWTHNGNKKCNIPVCSPRCFHGGSCINPNKCDCQDGRTGDLCEDKACASYLRPCFPGWCEGNLCKCRDGFIGSGCTTVESDDFKPVIDKCRTSFSYFDRTKNMQIYEYVVDGTGLVTSGQKEIIWTNQDKYNVINMTFEVSLDWLTLNETLPMKPAYIGENNIGVVSAMVDTLLTKLPVPGQNSREEIARKTYECTDISETSPIQNDPLKCKLNEESWSYRFDHGDQFTFNFSAQTGGYRKLTNTNTGSLYTTQYYTGPEETKIMEIRFDFNEPVHCSASSSCSGNQDPLQVAEDFTKVPISTRWDGWSDALSGIAVYTWEIFKLRPNQFSNILEEPEPLGPLEMFQINHTSDSTEYNQIYTPALPGMYSIIMEVRDAANNSQYVRRFVLYDPVSDISVSDQHKLFVSSAEAETGHIWQSWFGNESDGSTRISISWKNYFLNKLHEDEHLLNSVATYPPQLDDGGRRGKGYKKIESYEDNEGSRHMAAIPNLRGIVRFDIVSDYEKSGGGLSLENPPSSHWRTIPTLKDEESEQFDQSKISDGSTVKVWVRAHDVMGNNRTESTLVHFDMSKPEILQVPTRQDNIQNGTFPFASRIQVECRDEDSGVYKVHWKLRMANNRSFVKMEGDAINPVQPSTCITECYRTKIEERYKFNIEFDINHCWMRVPKENLDTQVMELAMEIYNSAMLSEIRIMTIDSIRSLGGIEDYFGPMHIKMTRQSTTGVSLSWDHAPSCYARDTILVEVVMPDNTTKTLRADKDADRFDITGLLPATTYPIHLYTVYIVNDDTGETIHSRASVYTIQTPAEPIKEGLSGGAIAGIVVSFLLIIIIVLAALLLWRTGRLESILNRARTRRHEPEVGFSSAVTKKKQISIRGVDNKNYTSTFDDDMIYYGEVDLATQPWSLSRKDISLEQQMNLKPQPRFASLYKAKMYSTHSADAETVVVKALKANHSEQDLMLMKAKINFYGTAVGNHPNILKFIGAVDDIALGPFMVLEHCENGTMKDYLARQKHSVNEQIHERFFKFAFDVCKGMEYLANRKIVHRRLAARNILLTFLNDVKISGFGPVPKEDEASEKAERLPVKWLPPECIQASSTTDATEKSDVWSFGIVMWEIFSVGDTPFPNVRSANLLSHLSSGNRPPKPEYSDDKMYDLMKKCWQETPKKRPSFSQLRADLEKLFVSEGNDEFYYDSKFIYDNNA